MLERLSVRLAPLTTRANELAPVAPACCNVCRTCTTTNIVGLALGGLSALALAVSSRLRPQR
jgi:enterochelin esterase-like enzyme